MRLQREAARLHDKAVASLSLGVEVFNRPSDVARPEAVLLLLHHAFEMLLKSIVRQRTGRIRASNERYTYSFEKCVGIVQSGLTLITSEEAIALRALDADRDAAMHHHIDLSEGLLYVRAQSAVTLFRDLLHKAFGENLTDFLPPRSLPISTAPPPDLRTLIEREVDVVRDLLSPGRRQTLAAQARLRALLDLEAAVGGRSDPPDDREVTRAMRRVREGTDWQSIFPGVATLGLDVQSDDAISVSVRITRSEGPPVQLVGSDEEALLYREVNPLDRWSLTFDAVRVAVGLSQWRLRAVLEHEGLDQQPHCHEHVLGSVKQVRWTPVAKDALIAALPTLDVEAIYEDYKARHKVGRRRRVT